MCQELGVEDEEDNEWRRLTQKELQPKKYTYWACDQWDIRECVRELLEEVYSLVETVRRPATFQPGLNTVVWWYNAWSYHNHEIGRGSKEALIGEQRIQEKHHKGRWHLSWFKKLSRCSPARGGHSRKGEQNVKSSPEVKWKYMAYSGNGEQFVTSESKGAAGHEAWEAGRGQITKSAGYTISPRVVMDHGWPESCYWSMMRYGQKLRELKTSLYSLTGNLLVCELEKIKVVVVYYL